MKNVDYLERIKKMQEANSIICPRCGRFSMKLPISKNALSRVADCYVCDSCGMDEALRAMGRCPQPVEAWYVAVVMNEMEAAKDE